MTWLERACFWPPSSAKRETTEVVENDWLAETRRGRKRVVSGQGWKGNEMEERRQR